MKILTSSLVASLAIGSWSFDVGGSVTDGRGTPLAGVTMTLRQGSTSLVAQTNSVGAYAFTGLSAADYSVVPTGTGRFFSPESVFLSALDGNRTLAFEGSSTSSNWVAMDVGAPSQQGSTTTTTTGIRMTGFGTKMDKWPAFDDNLQTYTRGFTGDGEFVAKLSAFSGGGEDARFGLVFRKESERMFSHKREDIMLGESVRTDASQRRADPHIQLTGGDAQADEARQAVAEADAPLPSMMSRREAPSPSILTSLERIEDTQAETPRATETVLRKDSPVEAPPAAAPAQPDIPPIRQAIATAHAPVAVAPAEPATTSTPAAWQHSGLDPDTEFVARLKFASPVLANFSRLLASLRRLGKPVRAFGKRPEGGWEALTSNPRYALEQVEFGIQLADRGGAISQDQLDAFCRALYEFSAEEGGAVTCSDKQDALRGARTLDLFGMDVDVLIGLNVVSSDARPFTSEAIHKLSEEGQLTLETDGTYHARDPFGHILFTLTNQEETSFPDDGRGLTTHGVTLLFDVPRVADGLAVFDRMTRLGFDLAWRLEGRLVDDNGRPVSEDSLNRDRARLSDYYARMEARGIPAGGERALRLFT